MSAVPSAATPLHAMRLDVRWGDMDALAHVNNAEYLRYFEQSRVEWLASLGYATAGHGEGPILLKSSITYLKPIVYPCRIEVRLFALRVGRTSFTIASELVNAHEPLERFTEGEFVIVWLDHDAGKPIAVPDSIRRFFPAVE